MAKKTTFTNNVPVRKSATHYQIESDSDAQIIYDLRFENGRWSCPCPSPEQPVCKHVRKLIQCIKFARQIFPDPSRLENLSQNLLQAQTQVEQLLDQIEGLQATNEELSEIVQKTAKKKRPVKNPTIRPEHNLIGQLVKIFVSGRAVTIDENSNIISCSCGSDDCPHLQAAADYLEKMDIEEKKEHPELQLPDPEDLPLCELDRWIETPYMNDYLA